MVFELSYKKLQANIWAIDSNTQSISLKNVTIRIQLLSKYKLKLQTSII